MSNLATMLLLGVGAVLLVILIVRLVSGLRRFTRTVTMVVSDAGDKAGLLRARSAGLRVAIEARRSAVRRS